MNYIIIITIIISAFVPLYLLGCMAISKAKEIIKETEEEVE